MVSLSQIGQAAGLYQNDHNGDWPENLDKLVLNGSINARMLTSPLDPQANPGYVYIRPSVPAGKIDRPDKRMIAYDAVATVEQGIPVVFADGHVETITDKDQFDALLKEAKEGAN